MEGMVLKIDRCSRHDGPGLRTVIFLKGCPLHCQWCSTPESQYIEPQLIHYETLCINCGRCIEVCPNEAIKDINKNIVVNRELCKSCGKCVSICLNYAMKIAGKKMQLEEVYEIVNRSRQFWNRMPGGVTISGGEALYQYEFTKKLLKKCYENGINTSIETSAFCSSDKIKKLLPYVDHVCCDVKHMDNLKHIRLTGVSNKQILENIRMISNEKDLILRFPIIPTCNDSDENILETVRFIDTLGKFFNRIDLMPYHRLGEITYQRLGYKYSLEDVPEVTNELIYKIKEMIMSFGIDVSISTLR